MKKSRFTDSQIIAVLKQAEAGTPVPDLCRQHGITSATFYKWRSKFGGMDVSTVSQLKELQDENRRLKKLYADTQLSAELLKEALSKNGDAVSAARDGQAGGPGRHHQHRSCVQDVRGESDLLPLSGQGQPRERDDRRLVAQADQRLPRLGLWAVLPAPAQREGLRLEPQARVSDLSRVGAESARQAAQAHRPGSVGASGGA